MNVSKIDSFNFEHVTLMDTGEVLPVVFRIDEGYRRGRCVKTEDGDYVAVVAVSNIKATEPTIDYEQKEDEEVIPLIGLVINKKIDAELLGDFFHRVAKYME